MGQGNHGEEADPPPNFSDLKYQLVMVASPGLVSFKLTSESSGLTRVLFVHLFNLDTWREIGIPEHLVLGSVCVRVRVRVCVDTESC